MINCYSEIQRMAMTSDSAVFLVNGKHTSSFSITSIHIIKQVQHISIVTDFFYWSKSLHVLFTCI